MFDRIVEPNIVMRSVLQRSYRIPYTDELDLGAGAALADFAENPIPFQTPLLNAKVVTAVQLRHKIIRVLWHQAGIVHEPG